MGRLKEDSLINYMSFKKVTTDSKIGITFSGDLLERLKETEISILNDVINICEKNNLRYIAFYGTLLGTIRHEGFIPWDDDVDISMPLDDMDSLIKIIKQEYKDKYDVYGLGYDGFFDPFCAVKISLKNTIFSELTTLMYPYKRGVSIDIFPAISCPKGLLKRRARKFKFSLLTHLCSIKFETNKCKLKSKEISDKRLRRYLRYRRFISHLFFFLSYERIYKKRIAFYHKKYDSDYLAIDGNGYKNYSFDMSCFTNITLLKFENISIKVPVEYDNVLKSLYGTDYMVLPPVEQREIQKVSEIVL